VDSEDVIGYRGGIMFCCMSEFRLKTKMVRLIILDIVLLENLTLVVNHRPKLA